MALTFIVLSVATAFFAVLTAGIHLVDGHGQGQFEGTARLILFFDSFIVTAFGVFLILAAVTGFALGSERTVRLFGVLWQTETPTRSEKWFAICMVLALLGTMLVYALRKLEIV